MTNDKTPEDTLNEKTRRQSAAYVTSVHNSADAQDGLVRWHYLGGRGNEGLRVSALARLRHKYPNGDVDVLVDDQFALKRAGLLSRLRNRVFVEDRNPQSYTVVSIAILRREPIEYVVFTVD